MDKEMFLTLYKSLVRPHLEYGSSVWSVIFKKDAIQLENVQRRATKLIPNISNLSYENRLKHLGIPSLQYRTTKGRHHTNVQDTERNRLCGQKQTFPAKDQQHQRSPTENIQNI